MYSRALIFGNPVTSSYTASMPVAWHVCHLAPFICRPGSRYQRYRGDRSGPDRNWRWLFLTGPLLGCGVTHMVIGQSIPAPSGAPLWLAMTGMLVGVGTRAGGSCTSGHGVCGLGRRSPRSLVATLTFMAFGVITVFVLQLINGVSS